MQPSTQFQFRVYVHSMVHFPSDHCAACDPLTSKCGLRINLHNYAVLSTEQCIKPSVRRAVCHAYEMQFNNGITCNEDKIHQVHSPCYFEVRGQGHQIMQMLSKK